MKSQRTAQETQFLTVVFKLLMAADLLGPLFTKLAQGRAFLSRTEKWRFGICCSARQGQVHYLRWYQKGNYDQHIAVLLQVQPQSSFKVPSPLGKVFFTLFQSGKYYTIPEVAAWISELSQYFLIVLNSLAKQILTSVNSFTLMLVVDCEWQKLCPGKENPIH